MKTSPNTLPASGELISRRETLARFLTCLPMFAGASSFLAAAEVSGRRMGVCTYSYHFHWKMARDGAARTRFGNPVEFLQYCHELGAGGVQIGLDPQYTDQATRIRGLAESLNLYFEGQVALPKEEADAERFEQDLRTARVAGAKIVRVAALSGRRYETFTSREAFRQFADRAWRAFTLAEAAARKHQLTLAIENHKDWRVPELVDILRRLGSEHVGVCLDTGNNIALIEQPMDTIEALAPFAVSVHLKDMAVHSYPDGFLLSEVPLGDGFLDLKKIVASLLRANPRIEFNLEMITRDPLKIPCLTDQYWAALDQVPAQQLGEALAMIRTHLSDKPLPRTAGMKSDAQIEFEDENVRRSFAYAREHLGLR